jgi:dihydroxy-acid dehydratase
MSWQTKFDIPLTIIGLLLLTTLGAFFSGVMPYPYGFIILSVALLGRILQLKGKE